MLTHNLRQGDTLQVSDLGTNPSFCICSAAGETLLKDVKPIGLDSERLRETALVVSGSGRADQVLVMYRDSDGHYLLTTVNL